MGPMRGNPALKYRELAKAIVAKLKVSIAETIDQGKMADPYWKLEQAIVDAMRIGDTEGSERTREQMLELLKEFDENDGSSSS